jgi:hypothetical protein
MLSARTRVSVEAGAGGRDGSRRAGDSSLVGAGIFVWRVVVQVDGCSSRVRVGSREEAQTFANVS